MNKEAKGVSAEADEAVDAKGTAAVVPAAETAVAEVQVEGARLEFPFVRIGQGMSQWRTSETRNGKPEEGAFYIGKSKDSNSKVADAGREAGIYCIVLDKVDGYKEDRVYQPGVTTGAPRRWVVGQLDAAGRRMTEEDCLAAAAAEDLSVALRPTGEVWPDTGRPKMRANLSKFCYLLMLVPVPDTIELNDIRVYPIGDRLYTTARMEFDRQYFKALDATLGNIKARTEFAFSQEQKRLLRAGKIDEKGYAEAVAGHRFSVNGLLCHIYSFEATNRNGIQYTSHAFELATENGRPRTLTDEERRDFTAFLMAAKAGMVASAGQEEYDGEF